MLQEKEGHLNGASTRDLSPAKLVSIAYEITKQEVEMCDAMSRNGAVLIK